MLPFVNMSSSIENEYFSDGITEEIINALAKIDGLKITSRTSSFHFKGKNIPITEIGNQLGVSILLEGSVRLAGDSLRITAQLIDAAEDFHFWSETWSRSLENIFAVQDEISLLIADKIREQIGHFEIEEKSPSPNTEISAYQWYLKSKSNFAKFQKSDILQALQEIEQAIEIDPNCAYYHASKAIYYGYLGLIKALASDDAFKQSKDAALKALQLDPTDPEANYAIGMVFYFFERDLATAKSYLNLALKFRPNYVNALLGGSVMDVVTGDYDLALSRLKKAMELDPLTDSHLYYLASALQRMGRYEEGLEAVNKILVAIPHHTNSYYLKGLILCRLQRYQEALQHFQMVPISPTESIPYFAGMGIVYAAQGNNAKAEEYLKKSSQEAQNLHLASEENPAVIINIYLGNLDIAFQEIENDIKAGKYYLNFFQEIPAFKLLAKDSRFHILDTLLPEKNQKEDKPELKASPIKSSLLSAAQIAEHRQHLLQHMQNHKPYLDSGLSLRSLAQQINLSPNQLSLVLNEGLAKNFNGFINQFRVEEFQRIAKEPSYSKLSIMGIAQECGFNSKTVFNSYFKQITGITPSQFMKA